MKSLKFTRNIFSILVLAFTFLLVGRVEGQVLLTDNFNYSGILTSNSWIAHSASGTNSLSTSSGLTYMGHSGSNQGNSVQISNLGGEDLNKSFTNIATNGQSVYLSFLINVTDQANSKTGDYFIHLGSPGGASWTSFYCRIFVRIVGGVVNFGLNNCSSNCTTTYGSTSFSKNTTYLVIAKYTITTSGNDPISLWVFPSGLPSSEQLAGTPELIHNTTSSGSDPINSIGLRQGNNATSVELKVDAINVGLTWLSVTPTCNLGEWIGSSSGNWSTASNWCGGVPTSSSNVTIANGTTVTLDNTSETIISDLTINGTLILAANSKLTVTGTLTNNGTMTIESGATFLQGPSSSIAAGTGTFNVKQAVTGAGGSTPTGRFWYMGLPINNLNRGTAFGAASGSNRLWSWTEGTGWSSQLTDNVALNPTTGYVFRTGSDVTLNFSGTSLYSANMNPTYLSNNGGPLGGCHLLSNPYTAYLDWAQVVAQANTGTSNISTTYCVRSYNSTNNEMVYDTYNASGVASNPSSLAVTQFIAPLQAFWIRVNTGVTGNLNITKSMLSHQSSGIGLKDITSFTAFARLNLVSGNFFDQVVVYTDANAALEVEDYDSEKFFLPNKPQVYCKVGEKKLVINALKSGKAQNAVPLTIELPSTQVYKFEMAESFVENGLVILEDRQEGIFQDMGVNPTYEFYGNSGVVADRFVLHFQLPNGTNNEGQAGVEDLTSAQIDIISNQQGEILVSLSSDLTATGDIQIMDAAGRLIQTTAIKGQDTKLQITEGTGVYFVRITTPMKSETKKVLVY